MWSKTQLNVTKLPSFYGATALFGIHGWWSCSSGRGSLCLQPAIELKHFCLKDLSNTPLSLVPILRSLQLLPTERETDRDKDGGKEEVERD